MYVAKANEELFGAWINPDYGQLDREEKFINRPDGVVLCYNTAARAEELWSAKCAITHKWVDAEGNIWYKWIMTEKRGGSIYSTYEYYYLTRISGSGTVLEQSYSGYDYPDELNPESLKYNYFIYYRQE
jgi:hypothetical protein